MKKKIFRYLRNKWFVLAFAAAYALIATVAGTFAWVTASDTRVNAIKNNGDANALNAKITEIFTPPGGVTAGGRVIKQVTVSNIGNMSCFVRVHVSSSVIDADGMVLPCNGPQEAGILSYDGLDGGSNWHYGEDGWWYYLKSLKKGADTAPLFEAVELSAGLGELYEDAGLTIDITMESVEIRQWEYRQAWWGSVGAPSGTELLFIDGKLSALAAP